MSTAVFPLPVNMPYSQDITFTNHVESLGDGFEKRVNKNLAFGPRADGNGGTSSYKGINGFTITMNGLEFSTGNTGLAAAVLWAFYVQQSGDLTPFYYYDLNQAAAIDLTGSSAIGRYLVRFKDGKLTRETLVAGLMKSGIQLIETRG